MQVWKLLPNTYFDSVTLMSLSARLKKEQPFSELILLMGTEMNKVMIRDVGRMNEEIEMAKPNDLIIVGEVENESLSTKWFEVILEELTSGAKPKQKMAKTYKTIGQAVKAFDANMAVISVPGIYAANEAFNALENELNVMLFSDNVSVEDEIALKKLAIDKGLLLMGPDCGTAIINGKGLCFANQIRSGRIGLIAASGTGLQEVSVLVHRLGGGISQAIGVGGRDLTEEVGGLMMLQSLEWLSQDEHTDCIVLISKPPHQTVQGKIIETITRLIHEGNSKQYVICFIDGGQKQPKVEGLSFVSTLTDAAVTALERCGINAEKTFEINEEMWRSIVDARRNLAKGQCKLKALYCGGTLAAEALSISRKYLKNVTSNVAKKAEEKMENCFESNGHNIVDLGDDIFTQGRPHPMIEPSIRLERILHEAENPETGVLLLDFELGYGSHEDPVGITYDTIIRAQEIARSAGRYLPIVAYVCGTDLDFQMLERQEEKLMELGVLLAQSNLQASQIAAEILKEVPLDEI